MAFSTGSDSIWFQILDFSDVAEGREHRVWHDKLSGRVVKFTYPDEFGRVPFYGSGGLGNSPGLPFEYLRRLVLSNTLFGDDVWIEAVLESAEGKLIIVTSQSFIAGDHPSAEEIVVYMQAEGFVGTRSGDWYRAADDMAVFDTHPGNFIRTVEGNIVPIDLYPFHHPDDEHLRMMGLKKL